MNLDELESLPDAASWRRVVPHTKRGPCLPRKEPRTLTMHDSAPSNNGQILGKHHVATTLHYWDDPGDGSRPTPIFIGKGRITNERPHLAHDFVVTDVSGDEDEY